MCAYFISEVSSNHNRSLERSLKFIKVSSDIGCQAVKFQLFKIDQLFSKEVLDKKPEVLKRKKWELPLEFIPQLSNYCHRLNIDFSCTPFYLEAVDELLPYVDFYKIASYELLWKDLLIKVAKTGKPVVISTGMATLDEISNSVNILRKSGCTDLTILHCNSSYPTTINDTNLSIIQTLRENFHTNIGWSDHTVNPAVIYRAIHKWDASMIEFHLDLEGKGEEYKSGHCWLPKQIGEVIKTIEEGFVSDGNPIKKPSESETIEREWRTDPSDGLRPFKHIRKKL